MSKELYNYLTESVLYRDEDSLWRRYSDSQLIQEIERYKEYTIDKKEAVDQEIKRDEGIKAFAGIELPDLDLVAHLSLYCEQVLIYDPIFKLNLDVDGIGSTFGQMLGYNRTAGFNRKKLQQMIRYLKDLTPYVVSDYVKLVPFDDSPSFTDGIPVRYSRSRFSDALPSELLEWFYEKVTVKSMTQIKDTWRVDKQLKPSRGIIIEFEGEDLDKSRIFNLSEQEIISVDRNKRIAKVAIRMPSTPPNEEYFRAWVAQSINSSAADIVKKVYLENLICASYNEPMYLTRSRLVSELLKFRFAVESNVHVDNLNALLSLHLPVLSKVSAADLMRIRNTHTEAFANFRNFLSREVYKLRLEQDPVRIQTIIQNIQHEITDTKMREIDIEMKNLSRTVFKDALVLSGILSSSFLIGGWSLIPSAIAAVQGIKSFERYYEKIRQNPGFLYWKLDRKGK